MSVLISHSAGPHIESLAFGMPGGTEWIILLILGLLIFGRRLPEVGRSLGRGIVEFKRGIKGIEDEIDDASTKPASLPKTASPELSESQASAVTPAAGVQEAKLAGEGPNPYAPAEKPAGDG